MMEIFLLNSVFHGRVLLFDFYQYLTIRIMNVGLYFIFIFIFLFIFVFVSLLFRVRV